MKKVKIIRTEDSYIYICEICQHEYEKEFSAEVCERQHACRHEFDCYYLQSSLHESLKLFAHKRCNNCGTDHCYRISYEDENLAKIVYEYLENGKC